MPRNVVPTCASVSPDSLSLCLLLPWVQFNIQTLLMRSPVWLLVSSTPQWPFCGEAAIFSRDKSVAFCCGFLLFLIKGQRKINSYCTTELATFTPESSHQAFVVKSSVYFPVCLLLFFPSTGQRNLHIEESLKHFKFKCDSVFQ